MLFGKSETFALEAIVEPGPDFPPYCGGNIAGRFRLFFGGLEVGKFSEPCCWLRPLSQHLAVKCASATALWHNSLAGKHPEVWFQLLDDALYLIGEPEPPHAYHRMDFLTNVSEALDGVKGFLVGPPGESLQVMLRLQESNAIHHHVISPREFCAVATRFAMWIGEEEQRFLKGKT